MRRLVRQGLSLPVSVIFLYSEREKDGPSRRRSSGVAEARPTLVPVLGNSACYVRCHLGRVLLPVVRSNGASHQCADRPDDCGEYAGLNCTCR
jgi:hypothetical protein